MGHANPPRREISRAFEFLDTVDPPAQPDRTEWNPPNQTGFDFR